MILLDECRGEYWRLASSTYALLELLQRSPLCFGEIAGLELVCDDLVLLINAGLVSRRRAFARPRLVAVAGYAVLHLWFQFRLRVFGWRVVEAERRLSVRRVAFAPHIMVISEALLSAARFAMLVPFVRADCLPRALSFHRLLRFRGHEAVLRIGAVSSDFEPHIWVEVGDERIDSGADDQALRWFRPLEHTITTTGDP